MTFLIRYWKSNWTFAQWKNILPIPAFTLHYVVFPHTTHVWWMKFSAQQWTHSESQIPRRTQRDTCRPNKRREEEEPRAVTELCVVLFWSGGVDEQTAVLLRTRGTCFYTIMFTLDCNEITPPITLCTLGSGVVGEGFHSATDALSWSRWCHTCSNVQ